MPVYGRSRTRRRVKVPLGREVHREPSGRRIFRRPQQYRYQQSSLALVSANLGVDLNAWVKRRYARTHRSVRVLDWGCGTGTAISTLAAKNKGIVECYGYSKASYVEWEKNKRVEFRQFTASGFLRTVKDQSFDLIYSHYGLFNLMLDLKEKHPVDFPQYRSAIRESSAYILNLAQKLRLGGSLYLNIPSSISIKLVPYLNKHFFGKAVSREEAHVAFPKWDYSIDRNESGLEVLTVHRRAD